jgi:hypothetical protein
MDMISLDEPVVGTIYRQRRFPTAWAGSVSGEPIADCRDKFGKVEAVGMGCTLIRRDAAARLIQTFPELNDTRIPADSILEQTGCKRLFRFFDKLDIPERGVLSEDLSFCMRWNQCGGTVWAAIGYDISHVGYYDYQANYQRDVTQNARSHNDEPIRKVAGVSQSIHAAVSSKNSLQNNAC